MSRLLWRALIVSPAILGATLLFSAGAVRAADSSRLIATDSQTSTAAAQAPITEAQKPEAQSNLKVDTAELTASTAKVQPEFSTSATETPADATQTPAELKISDVKVPAEVSLNVSQPTSANPTEEAPAAVAPAANPTLAQTPPGEPSNTDVLNQINRYSREGAASQDQVTNVTQLSDVRPTDWAYEALRSLVERYGCIAGYPDGTYRGNRALTRYEFAAGLNACLQQIERLIATSTSEFVTRGDLETLQRLVDEFRTELATLGTRVDQLEGRVAFLEDRQFSTTTKLQGEAIFALTDEFNQGISNNTVFQDRVRLTFNTSFTGQDRLVTRLTAGNAELFRDQNGTPLSEGQQTFNFGSSGDNDVVLDWLAYYFNFGASKVYLAATGGIHSDYAPTLNPYFEDYDGGNGALSTFASESPIYRIGGGAGAAVSFGVGPLESVLGPSTLTVGYLAGAGSSLDGTTFGANDPSEKAGLFDGDYAALGQLNFNLGDRIGIGATYVHGYHNTDTAIFDAGGANGGFPVVGSLAANFPSSFTRQGIGGNTTPVVTNTYGGEVAFRLSENISISGFGSYTRAILIGQGTGDIWSYGGGLAFSDFGSPGSVLGLFAGVEPTLRGLSTGVRPDGGFARDNVWHFEGFYKYKLNNNISVTPGVIWITAPGQNDANDDAIIGTLRTTFTF
ncbi:MAG: iron uptake porin [Cyanobacteriota bacterium]